MEKISAKYVDDLVDDDEIPELTEEDFARAVPFAQLPAQHQAWLLALRRPTQAVPLAEDVLRPFQSHGEGWEHRIEAALREWLREHAA